MTLDLFLEKNPRDRCYRVADEDLLASWADRAPSLLVDEWRREGLCSYGRGLVWFTDPREFESILAEWVEPSERLAVIGRTALGDLLLWGNPGLVYLDVQYGDLTELTGDFGLFVNVSLTSDEFLDEVVGRPLFEAALDRLGPLAPDEMYGFEPVLALGGSGEPETLARVKLREHLAILAQAVLGT